VYALAQAGAADVAVVNRRHRKQKMLPPWPDRSDVQSVCDAAQIAQADLVSMHLSRDGRCRPGNSICRR